MTPAVGSPLTLDGAHGEGGGALFRTALTMSVLTQQPARILNVRGGTKCPGLNAEDRTVLHALARCCKAETDGSAMGSSDVAFAPRLWPTNLNGALEGLDCQDSRSANALVVLNALIPVLLRSGAYSTVTARGETYGHNVLSCAYFAEVTLHALRHMGA